MIKLFLQDLINISWLKIINVGKIVIGKKGVPRCVGCYERLRKEVGRNKVQKKCKQVNTMCETCETNPYYCIDCF